MSHHLPQESQQQPERGRQQQRGGGGIMDLRNFCQRLDVDGLKAKLPAMPQLKLPKSLPKLRGARRIFRGESGSGSGNKAVPQQGAVAGAAVAAAAVAGATSGHQAAQFINRTPQRISTISSLMHEQTDVQQQQVSSHHLQPSGATYCSAGSLDDDYYAPYGSSNAARASRPISPIKMPAESQEQQQQQQGGTLTQRLQRGYKSLSELRLKHLFAKQTVVRRDGIEVQRYVEQYEAERRVEQMTQARRDRQIADNYDIHISTLPITRQNTLRQSEEKEVEQEDDESGLETPPAVARKRKPVAGSGGIAATRFAKVRQPPLQMPVAEESQDEQQPAKQPMRQAVKQQLKRLRKSIKRRQQQSDEGQPEQRASAASTLRARMRRFASSEQLPQRWRQSFTAGETTGGIEAATAATAGGGGGVAAQLERGLGKLNEKLQQLKFFQRKSQQQQQQQQQNKPNTVGREPVEIDDEELAATYHHSDSDDGSDDGSDDSGQDVCAEEAFGQLEQQQQSSRHQTLATLAQFQAHASTAWSSDSLEEIDPLAEQQQQQQLATTACDYPRVLIHQQHNTDGNESTLIIAVTTTPPTPPHSQQHQWVPNEQIIAGFNEQPAPVWPAPQLYKPKSIDIFESGDAFADFDEALRNAPVLRISAGSSDSNGDGDNDGDGDEDADDSSSRVTRIRVQTPQIGNSCESLMEQQTLEQEEQEQQEEEQQEEHEELERPPSVSPPPPPLPQRRAPPPSTVAPIYDAVPPPLPISKPPATTATAAPAPAATATATTIAATSPVIAAPPACRQPLRSASMTRPAKPLVKTSSLRLTYREQMHPNDVGKVNKLISRFGGRPRRLHSEELTICSDDDDDDDDNDEEEPTTPTPSNHNNNIIPDIVTTAASNSNNNNNDYETMQLDRQNSNCSRSEYGSPLAYPQQQQQLNATTATATTTTTTTTTIIAGRAGRTRAPQPQSQSQLQLQLQRRSRRSMTRDDDNFYSFDSDEENSYYSISPSSSSRYVVEI